MTVQGAVSDNDIAVERREAQRPALLAARIPTTVSPLATGDTAVDARLIENGRPGGPPLGQASASGASQAPGAVASRVYPTCALNSADLG
jgi:hypothetical protein